MTSLSGSCYVKAKSILVAREKRWEQGIEGC
jgi:hypothetical protein